MDECLDRWEIETLAEVCRSLKHFDEAAVGRVSESDLLRMSS